jgi:hypothetical protein
MKQGAVLVLLYGGDGEINPKPVLFSDEASFYLTGYMKEFLPSC